MNANTIDARRDKDTEFHRHYEYPSQQSILFQILVEHIEQQPARGF